MIQSDYFVSVYEYASLNREGKQPRRKSTTTWRFFDPLRSNNTIFLRLGIWSTFVSAMHICLVAPSHYRNQCSLINQVGGPAFEVAYVQKMWDESHTIIIITCIIIVVSSSSSSSLLSLIEHLYFVISDKYIHKVQSISLKQCIKIIKT